jgi:protein-L-isoaspartate(D-aspartate) O-methyltransferase
MRMNDLHRIFVIALVGGITIACTDTVSADNLDARRQAMVAEVEAMVRDTAPYTGRHRLDERVIYALGRVPRHELVPDDVRSLAYANRALPIGHGQTISQPYIVALMTDLAQVKPGYRVLEIGTGSGYQAAVLAELEADIYTIEIVEPLGRQAQQDLQRLGYDNVHVRIGDGYKGWPEAAPFDAILVTAAPEEVPQALIDQLAVGGRMVIPVGAQGQTQTLTVLVKEADGTLQSREVLPVGFVPMVPGEEPE